MPKKKKGVDSLDEIKGSKNVRKACQQLGISRSQYYKLLKSPDPTAPKPYFPSKIGLETANRIVELALFYPHGCRSISYKLATEGNFVSPVSVQKILNQHGLGIAQARFEALEQKILSQKTFLLNAEQKEFIWKYNPALLEVERNVQSPGELISVFTYFLGQLPLLGKVFINFGLDAFSGYVHASVSFARDKYLCAELLEGVIFPFYVQKGVEIRCIETSNDPEFFSYSPHPVRTFLLGKPTVVHHRRVLGGEKTNGYCQRFQHYLSRFILPELKKNEASYSDLEPLHEDLNVLIEDYNQGSNLVTEKYYKDYPLFGKSPLERINTVF